MSTTIRPEVSKDNQYYINKHRYYELKHFVLQYKDWQKCYLAADSLSKQPRKLEVVIKTDSSDPTARCAEVREYYRERMDMVELCAKLADYDLADYILKGVTEELSYDYLKANLNIPCSKDMYYEAYRRFFWFMSRKRQ